MSISYLNNLNWSDWTREERFFCSCLYEQVNSEPAALVRLINSETSLNLKENVYWDIGYEVCLYRDYQWHRAYSPIGASQYSQKRTFDLCLFSEDTIVIIEAKAFGRFSEEDGNKLARDRKQIPELLAKPNLKVCTVALASSIYFENHAKYGKPDILDAFDARLTWHALFKTYHNALFEQADKLYKSLPTFA